jgi:hypothetical protein
MFQPLCFWNDLTHDESGGIYLLLNNPSKMIIYHYDKNGVLIERLIGPEDDVSLIYLRDNKLWAFGKESLLFYLFEI